MFGLLLLLLLFVVRTWCLFDVGWLAGWLREERTRVTNTTRKKKNVSPAYHKRLSFPPFVAACQWRWLGGGGSDHDRRQRCRKLRVGPRWHAGVVGSDRGARVLRGGMRCLCGTAHLRRLRRFWRLCVVVQSQRRGLSRSQRRSRLGCVSVVTVICICESVDQGGGVGPCCCLVHFWLTL